MEKYINIYKITKSKFMIKIRGVNIKLSQLICLAIYYSFLKYLPNNNSLFFGKFWKFLRYRCCKHIFLKCGTNINIQRNVVFGSGRNIEIGDNSGIGENSVVPSNTAIGKNVMIGPLLYILNRNHKHNLVNVEMIYQGYDPECKTIIEDDVWIGRQVLIMPGRNIKKGSIIAGGCVLTKTFDEYSVVGGNPSVLLKKRK